jgi:hypothetical protein
MDECADVTAKLPDVLQPLVQTRQLRRSIDVGIKVGDVFGAFDKSRDRVDILRCERTQRLGRPPQIAL